MDYKPQDVFLGVIDLFAILLPGMVLGLFMAEPVLRTIESQGGALSTPARWLAFFFGSYALGHFLSLIGAYVMDQAYDLLRDLRPWFLRHVWDKVWRRSRGRDTGLQERAGILLATLLPQAFDRGDSSVKWAIAFVSAARPELSARLDRKEADQKLFRSLTIVFGLIPVFLMARHQPWWSSIFSWSLAILSFIRYCDQRGKYAELAYLSFFTLHRTGQLNSAKP